MSAAVTPLDSLNAILAGEPPRQHALFEIPPEGVWVYRVEYRVQLKRPGVDEQYWSEWYHATSQHTCLPWYKREKDAEKALKRYRARYDLLCCWGGTPREYRVEPVWYAELPYRRDLDENRKNAARIKRVNKKLEQDWRKS